jgi:hypothetical protein
MITAKKKLIGAICSIGIACGVISEGKAAVVTVQLDWGDSFAAKDSSNMNLSTETTTLRLGMFDVVPTNWSGVNLSNINTDFRALSSSSYQGIGQPYQFTIDTTLIDEAWATDSRRVQAFLVVTSGSSQLGVFTWTKGAVPFYLPRDPEQGGFSDRNLLATSFGTPNFNMTALVGSISANGIVTASASGATTSPQTISFASIPSKTVGDSFTLGATASSSLPVSYSSSNPSVATVVGNVVTIVGSGSVVITASQGGNSSYSPATEVSQGITTYMTTALRVASLGTPILNGGQTSVEHTFIGNPNATYTIEYKTDLTAATWSTITVQTGVSGTFPAIFTSSGDYVNAWKNRMFFRAKNS